MYDASPPVYRLGPLDREGVWDALHAIAAAVPARMRPMVSAYLVDDERAILLLIDTAASALLVPVLSDLGAVALTHQPLGPIAGTHGWVDGEGLADWAGGDEQEVGRGLG